MSRNAHQRLKSIGLKVSEEAFERLFVLAERSRKPLAEWCRDKILEAVGSAVATPSEHAIMAEIAATQAILIDLIYTWSHDGKLTQKAVQEIVRSAQRSKFKEAGQLFHVAASRWCQNPKSQAEETRPGESS